MNGNNKMALPVTSVSLKTLLNNGNLPRQQMVTIVLPNALATRPSLSRRRGGRDGRSVARGLRAGPREGALL